MSDIHATDTSVPGGWIDLRERPSTGGVKTAARPQTSKVDPDAAIVFTLFLTLLFIAQLDTAGAVLFTLISVGYAASRLRRLSAVLVSRAFLLAIPAVAVLSVLWSEEPLLTIKYSLEYALTVVVALLLSAAPRPKAIIEAIFVAFAIYLLLSVALGQTVALGADGDTAFAGLNDSKNYLADSAAVGFLISLVVFFIGIEDRKFSRCAAAFIVAAGQIYAIFAARSAGALVGVVIAAAGFFFLLCLRKMIFPVRATALGVLGVVLTMIALAYETLSDVVVDVATRYFDKDMTFTGRTYLWQRAGDLIAEKPLLGRGFHAFWNRGNPDAEGMWRYLNIRSESGFNFHSSFVEILVHLGWFGLIVFALTLSVALVLVLRRFLRRPDLALCFWLSLLLYQCVRMSIETIGTYEFSFTTVLLFIGFGFALAPIQVAPTHRSAMDIAVRRAPRR